MGSCFWGIFFYSKNSGLNSFFYRRKNGLQLLNQFFVQTKIRPRNNPEASFSLKKNLYLSFSGFFIKNLTSTSERKFGPKPKENTTCSASGANYFSLWKKFGPQHSWRYFFIEKKNWLQLLKAIFSTDKNSVPSRPEASFFHEKKFCLNYWDLYYKKKKSEKRFGPEPKEKTIGPFWDNFFRVRKILALTVLRIDFFIEKNDFSFWDYFL